MKDLPPLGNPHASMRMLIEGTGNRLRFWPSDNFGDDIRGHFFYDAARDFPRSVTVVDPHGFPYAGPQCWVEIVRNPTQGVVDLMRQKVAHTECRCRIILDVTAPWWGDVEVEWPDGEPEPMVIQMLRAATLDLASFAHVITMPWPDYVENVRKHVGLNTWYVPDFNSGDVDGSLVPHAVAWGLAIQQACLLPSRKEES